MVSPNRATSLLSVLYSCSIFSILSAATACAGRAAWPATAPPPAAPPARPVPRPHPAPARRAGLGCGGLGRARGDGVGRQGGVAQDGAPDGDHAGGDENRHAADKPRRSVFRCRRHHSRSHPRRDETFRSWA